MPSAQLLGIDNGAALVLLALLGYFSYLLWAWRSEQRQQVWGYREFDRNALLHDVVPRQSPTEGFWVKHVHKPYDWKEMGDE